MAGILAIVFLAVLSAPFALVAFGGGSRPPVMESIRAPFADVDFSDLPERRTFQARDGMALAYRRYRGDGAGAVIALHGSSTEGRSLHPLARSLSNDGYTVYVPDIRGHGDSGERGDVAHADQLVEDVADLARHVRQAGSQAPVSLVGFSSGGGLALKYAGSGQGRPIDQLVLVAPMLGIDSAPYTDDNEHAREGEWTKPFVPRIVGLSMLNAAGIHAFDGLPVIAFAVDPADEDATATYSHRLLKAMNPENHRALLEAVPCPVTVLAGDRDEVFTAASYPEAVHAVRPEAEVRLIEDTGHVGMTLEPDALSAISASLPDARD